MTTYKIGTYKAGQQIAKEVFESNNLDEIREEFIRMFNATDFDPEGSDNQSESAEQAWDWNKSFSEDTNYVGVFECEEGQPLMTGWIYTGMTSNQLH